MADNIRTIGPEPYPAEFFMSLAESLDKGAVIGYPTETVYGLGCDAGNREAVERVYRLKGREYDVPFLMLIREKGDVLNLTESILPGVEDLMEAFWPGPLTLIFQAGSGTGFAHCGKERIAIRISSDPICRMLLDAFHKPLISTSANPTGCPPAHTAEEVFLYFNHEIDCILNGGQRRGLPSTILDVSGEPFRLIRRGSLTRASLEKLLGRRIDEESV